MVALLNHLPQEHRQPGQRERPEHVVWCFERRQQRYLNPFPSLSSHLSSPLLSLQILTQPSSEVAKGHTDASATSRLTAAKDAASDKVDEKKHDVRLHLSSQPLSLSLSFPLSSSFLPSDPCRANTTFPTTDQVGRLRQQVGHSLVQDTAYLVFLT